MEDWTNERSSLGRQLEEWRADWESLDTDRYLAHYSADFSGPDMDFDRWSQHKRLVNSGKTWIKVKVSNLSMFEDPSRAGLVSVSFDQEYRSNNLVNTVRKHQYWLREGESWRIIYEGTV
jgi:hypothetical protein